jgi:transcription elongation GreA/GreB family factor
MEVNNNGVRNMQGVSAHIEYLKPKGKNKRLECKSSYDNICQYNKSEHYLTKCVGKRCKYYSSTPRDKKSRENLNNKSKESNIDRKTHPYLNKTITLVSLKTKNEIRIKIVKDNEEIPFEGLYSQSSEVGKELLDKRINDIIVIKYCSDEFKYRIKYIK